MLLQIVAKKDKLESWEDVARLIQSSHALVDSSNIMANVSEKIASLNAHLDGLQWKVFATNVIQRDQPSVQEVHTSFGEDVVILLLVQKVKFVLEESADVETQAHLVASIQWSKSMEDVKNVIPLERTRDAHVDKFVSTEPAEELNSEDAQEVKFESMVNAEPLNLKDVNEDKFVFVENALLQLLERIAEEDRFVFVDVV